MRRLSARRARRNEGALALTETPAFQKWFGYSAAIDRDRKPLVVYHGTKRPGHTVLTPRTGLPTGTGEALLGTGLYFSTRADIAADYAGEEGAIYPCHLRVEMPFVRGRSRWGHAAKQIAHKYLAWLRNENYADGKMSLLDEGQLLQNALPPDIITEMLRADGYDGVVDGHIWMVLDSTQVKSATGNRGTFDAKDPDIRHNPRRARRNEGAPTLRDLAFQPIPNIPDSKRVSLDFKNGHYLTIAGAPSFPDQGDGTSTWAVQVTEGRRSYNLNQQTREQVEALIGQLAAKPVTDEYLQQHDDTAYQARMKERREKAEAERKAAEDAAHKRLMTPKFRKWFGKSKVVDKQGRPLKVYHGSQHAGFHAFDTSEQQKPGFFFTDNLAMARSYTSRHTDVELPYFRKLKDALAFEETSEFPLTIEKVEGGYDVRFDGSYVGFYGKGETKAMLEDINAQSTRYPGIYEVYLRMEDPLVVDAKGANWSEIPYDDGDGVQYLETNDISRMAQDADYDGVIIRDVSDPGGHGYGTESGDVYIVFNPNQIKSTQNIGAYSRDTDDLRLNPRKPRAARNPRRRRSRG